MNSMLYNNNNDPIFFCDNEIRYGSANNGYALQNNDYCGPNGQTEESSLAAQLFSPPPEIKPLLDYWVTNRSYTMPDRQQWAALEHVIPWSVANKYIQQGRLSVALQSQTEPDQPDERSSPHGQLLPSSRSLQDSSRSTRTNQENAGSSKVRYSCIEPGCNANFVSSNRESCKRHLRDHTQPSEIFICTVPRSDLSNCGFKHHRIDKFKDHLESEHNLRKSEQQHPHKVDNPDRCRHKVCPYPQCGEEFNIPEDYYEHYLHHYEGEGRDDGASLCTTTYTTHNNGREGRDSRYLDGGHDNYSMGTSSNSNRGSQRRRGSRRAAARSNNRNNNNNNNQEGSKEKPRRPRKRKNGNQFPTETTTYGSNGLECNNATTMTSLDNNWLFNGNGLCIPPKIWVCLLA